MASGFTPSIFDSSHEMTNGVKLMRLIVDFGTEALRRTFTQRRPDDLQFVLASSQPTLSGLRGRIIIQNQWDKLYPTPPNKPDIKNFDITLMCILLRNICGLSPPKSSVWENEPTVSDSSVEADIVRIRFFRNKRFGHMPNTAVSTRDFETYWAEVSSPLVRLGIDQTVIDRLKDEKCGIDEFERVLKEWNECDTETNASLRRIEHTLQTIVPKQAELRSESVLDKQLVCLDFQSEIEFYYEKFTEGTREWVFEQVNRAFVISALAGMGKSVIAAVICKTFAEHIGACHFFQYNNSRYNNPNSLLQSLAWQVCKVIPAYKEALIEKLSGNLGQSLNNMNIEGLFSLLFKEPFSIIAGNGKRILIVLDAVDESEHEGKQDLANLIANHFHKLPSNIRFLITTRPEKNLIEKFKMLNPLFIKGNDERNLDDIKLVLKKKISCVSVRTADLIADKSDGLMLYAFFLSEIYKDGPSIFCIADFPQGLGEFFEKYIERLKCDLNERLEISEDTFLSFLSALSVAMEPLPEAFIESLFGFKKNSPSTKLKVRKAMNTLSSLLVVNENKSISFFHKSMRDWLVDNSEHDYMVDERCGHKILSDLCVEELNELKKNDVIESTQPSVALKYALRCYVPHMLNGTDNNGRLEFFANDFVADLEIMFASVCVDVDLTLNNISSLMNHELYKHFSENMRTTVNELFFLGKRFAFLLRDCPQSFLQHVVNECDEKLSLKASHLLKTRYRNIIYLELVEKKMKRDALEFRCLLSGVISGIDVSPEHDYVVCSYKQGGIELFSLVTGKSEWKIGNFTVGLRVFPWPPNYRHRPKMMPHCIVFHPRERLILPGRLDMVLTLKGTFMKTELFQCGDNDAKFENCCFSKDGTKLVTNYRLDLVVWNTLSGEKETSLKCPSQLLSFSFTANGTFLGTTSVDNDFAVYDVIGKCNLVKSVTIVSDHPVEIVSTFEQNCWCCFVDRRIAIVNHNLELYFRCKISDVVLPSNLYSCKLQCFFEDPKQSWFSKVKEIMNSTLPGLNSWNPLRYIEVRDKSLLLFACFSNAMFVFRINDVINAEERRLNVIGGVLSNISSNGNFVYLRLHKEIIVRAVESDLSYSIPYLQPGQLDFTVVRDGVILYGQNRTPNLWNCDLTKCEESFEELAGSVKCLSLSEELIACVYKSDIIFFDIALKKIVFRMTFTENVREVYACSIKFHVLTKMESDEIPLWKDGVKVEGWADILGKYAGQEHIFSATFSPQGNRLALQSILMKKLFIFDVTGMSVTFLSHVKNVRPAMTFLNNENLLCASFRNNLLRLINVERGEILTCLDFANFPAPLSVSRERSIVCVGQDRSEDFQLIKVWLPRTT